MCHEGLKYLPSLQLMLCCCQLKKYIQRTGLCVGELSSTLDYLMLVNVEHSAFIFNS